MSYIAYFLYSLLLVQPISCIAYFLHIDCMSIYQERVLIENAGHCEIRTMCAVII